jgi:predicted TIM-barrel fold metal-dependent hydrolase
MPGGIPRIDRRAAVALGGAMAAFGAVGATEDVADPAVPFVDPHHHLWNQPATAERPASIYELAEFLADTGSGHAVAASVFVECLARYRANGPVELRSLGETEYVAAIAAESASGRHGPTRVAAGIVANVDLSLGDRARGVLEAHAAAAQGRLKGIRNPSAWDDYPVMGRPLDRRRKELLLAADFRAGFAALRSFGLVFDA